MSNQEAILQPEFRFNTACPSAEEARPGLRRRKDKLSQRHQNYLFELGRELERIPLAEVNCNRLEMKTLVHNGVPYRTSAEIADGSCCG